MASINHVSLQIQFSDAMLCLSSMTTQVPPCSPLAAVNMSRESNRNSVSLAHLPWDRK